MNVNSYQKSTGCGCGGSSSASLCNCGGTGCASCQGQGITRPRFFAGQLLTEDDLQLLTNYVGYKNRLHNRHLFGAGVVCGLEVDCHPCGEGQVIVHPGYALDCCGNDLTLDCATTLNINTMIRDLRRDQLGALECEDPCPDPSKVKANAEANANAGNRSGGNQAGVNPEKPKQAPLKYCLYIRYCEQQSDPVMPYSTGEDCGRQSCEATRVREGVKFELRCMPTNDSPHPLIRRLCECLGDLNKLQRVIKAAQQLSRATDLASNTLFTDSKVFTDEEASLLGQKTNNLSSALSGPAGGAAARAEAEPARAERFVISPELLQSAGQVALGVNRFEGLKPEEQTRVRATEGFRENLHAAQESIERVRSVALGNTKSVFMLVRDWLVERLNNTPYLSDCTLRQRVFGMVLPEFGRQVGEAGARLLIDANRPLLEAFISYLRDCASRVLNPACEPCDDTGVLLACFEVKECAVVRICNLERTYVLSPVAVRYWMPPLRLIGNLIERLCCDPFDSLLSTVQGTLERRPNFEKLLEEEVTRILKDSLCSFSDANALDDTMSSVTRFFRGISTDAIRPAFSQVTDMSRPPEPVQAKKTVATTEAAQPTETPQATETVVQDIAGAPAQDSASAPAEATDEVVPKTGGKKKKPGKPEGVKEGASE